MEHLLLAVVEGVVVTALEEAAVVVNALEVVVAMVVRAPGAGILEVVEGAAGSLEASVQEEEEEVDSKLEESKEMKEHLL